MQIITWNANRVNRWDQLWSDPLVSGLQWDVICLQEAGNPRVEWTHTRGPQWSSKPAERATDLEMVVIRHFTFQPTGYPQDLYIVHAEWVNKQKNHLVTITKTPPSWATSISTDLGIRPTLAIKARLNLSGVNHDVLLGCTHIISSDQAMTEVLELVPLFNSAAKAQRITKWLVFGDFNCDPGKLHRQVSGELWVEYPPGRTQDKAKTAIDYLLANVDFGETGDWQSGTAKSDHLLMCYSRADATLQVI